MLKKIVRWILGGCLALLMVIVTAWAMTAIFYSNLPTPFLRKLAMAVYAVLSILALVKIRPKVSYEAVKSTSQSKSGSKTRS